MLSHSSPLRGQIRGFLRLDAGDCPGARGPFRTVPWNQGVGHWLSWSCLAAILVAFLLHLRFMSPVGYFGVCPDDAVYFSSAKALAQGHGYIIASFPGGPPQTKYPVLYPWLLSWIWRFYPSFPANIVPAAWITAFFTCWFLAAAFELLRRLAGVGDWTALAIVSLCAFEPHVLVLSRCLLSDVPFAALALTAAVVGDRAMQERARPAFTLLAGVVAALSVMTRTIGVAVAAGIVAAALHRRAYRKAALFLLVAAPWVLVSMWAGHPALTPAEAGSPWQAGTSALALPGWQQSLLYYTNYGAFWRLCVPSLGVFGAMLAGNLALWVKGMAVYLFSPTLQIEKSLAGNAIGGIVSAGAVAGILRQARSDGWKPIHFIIPFYFAVVLIWNFPILDRFFLPFLPLFYMGLWVEGKHLVHLALSAYRDRRPLGERVVCGITLAVLATLSGVAIWNYRYGYRSEIAGQAEFRTRMWAEKAQAYDWIRRNTGSGTRIIAYDDASLYLYAGRAAVRPISFSTEYVYTRDMRVLERDLAHISDVACAIRAHFWLVSEDDFYSELQDAQPLMKARVAQRMSGLPEVYHSERIQLYDISRLLQPAPSP